MEKQVRPKNLNLLTIQFPIPAIISILHRISGVILFLLIPFFLWALHFSLSSESHFATLHDFFEAPLVKFILWGVLSAFIYHFIAGIRHLLMDVHIGEALQSGKRGAQLVIVLTLLFMVLTGIWLW